MFLYLQVKLWFAFAPPSLLNVCRVHKLCAKKHTALTVLEGLPGVFRDPSDKGEESVTGSSPCAPAGRMTLALRHPSPYVCPGRGLAGCLVCCSSLSERQTCLLTCCAVHFTWHTARLQEVELPIKHGFVL